MSARKYQMNRKGLVLILSLALIFEIIFAAAALFVPVWTLQQFGINATKDTLFLAFGLGGTFVFISAICALSLTQICKKEVNGHILAYVLGIWWIGIGLAIFFKFGKIGNLFIDSLKGALIVSLNAKALQSSRKS